MNTTNEKVDLNANPCGKALLKVAGKELLNECKKVGSLQEGEMASTGSANLNCQRVYHVRSSSWDGGKGTPVILVYFWLELVWYKCYSYFCCGENIVDLHDFGLFSKI